MTDDVQCVCTKAVGVREWESKHLCEICYQKLSLFSDAIACSNNRFFSDSKEQTENIPAHLIYEDVLSYLDLKSLLKVRGVCKSWYNYVVEEIDTRNANTYAYLDDSTFENEVDTILENDFAGCTGHCALWLKIVTEIVEPSHLQEYLVKKFAYTPWAENPETLSIVEYLRDDFQKTVKTRHLPIDQLVVELVLASVIVNERIVRMRARIDDRATTNITDNFFLGYVGEDLLFVRFMWYCTKQ